MPPDTSPLALTPSAFLEALAARVAALNDAGAEPVRLRGIPVKTSGTARIYGGFVYAAIRDPRTTEAIDARVPEKLAASMEWGCEAMLVGLVRFKSSRGEIKPEFRVDDVQEPGGARLLAKDELMARWGQAITRAKADVRVALLVDRPRLRIITGVGSVAVDDIRAQLREAEEEVELRVVRVSMHRPEEVAKAVRQAGDAHLVAVTRGGGQDVHELEADELIGAVASSPVPVVAALGHAPDDLVLGRVADAAFPTPTAFGVWLRACVDEKRARARRLKEAEVLERTDGLLRQLEALQAAAGRLAWWRTAALVLAGLLLAVLLWVLLGR